MTILERLRARADITESCWTWRGATVVARGGKRYGKVYVGSRRDGTRRNAFVHRVAYEAAKGPLRGECDHLCRNTLCFNPDHLEDVTRSENEIRKYAALHPRQEGDFDFDADLEASEAYA